MNNQLTKKLISNFKKQIKTASGQKKKELEFTIKHLQTKIL